MDLSSFSDVVLWVQANGYPIMFVAMVIEGPVVSAAAAFAAALGTFNIGIVFLLSLTGDLVGDLIYYFLGHWGKIALLERIGLRLGFTQTRFNKMTKYMEDHLYQAILIFKIVPLISFTGFAAAGASRIKTGRFFLVDLLLTLPFTLFFVGLGYYSGVTFELIYSYVNTFQYAVLTIIILALIGYAIYHQAIKWVTSKMSGEIIDNE